MQTIIALTLTLLVLLAGPTPAQANTVKFAMPYLNCFQTTEAGEDEIYVVISGRRQSGQSFQTRLPDPSGHWDLNDGADDPPLRAQNLLNIDMNEGDEVDFVVLIMEEDGGTVGGWADLAGGILGFLDAGAGSLISAIGNLFNIEDSDDLIGAVSVHIKMAGGQALATFRPVEKITTSWDTSSYWSSRPMSMNGDGSNYDVTFEVK